MMIMMHDSTSLLMTGLTGLSEVLNTHCKS
jgi:hypothetical protein